MALKDVHDKVDEIPEEFRPLYTQKGDKWELTGIQGVKTSADVERLTTSLKKERDEHKATKAALTAWGDLKPDEVHEKLERIPELETLAKGKVDETKLEEMANRRADAVIKSRITPIERENAKLKAEREALLTEKTQLVGEARTRKIHDKVRTALTAQKVIPEAHEDVLLLSDRIFELTEEGKVVTKDGVGVTPGIEPEAWLTDQQPRKPHWWPSNVGGGAKGSGAGGSGTGANPWSADSWNVTAQGQYMKQHGIEKAKKAAEQAGVIMGASAPAKRK